MESILENRFYGVYLLCSENAEKRFKGKCYIGFTVNPVRRIRQHNRGVDFGGARKTNNRGPWTMVLIVHGFPNNISALQFEWAWQQPSLSSRLKIFPELKRKRAKETYLEYNIRILEKMLNVGPWERLPLTIQWLDENYQKSNLVLLLETALPVQIKINICEDNAPLDNKKKSSVASGLEADEISCLWLPKNCHLCMEPIVGTMAFESTQKRYIRCCRSTCKLICHLICLANYLISQDTKSTGHYIPIQGSCPLCNIEFLWIDLLRNQQRNIDKEAHINREDRGLSKKNHDLKQGFENENFNQDFHSDEDLEQSINLSSSPESFNSDHSHQNFESDKGKNADIIELSD